mmetsp:Transcript_11837/g.25229  ORF Transcript_11837/g.25229 Transcript_11837/m.25229 type:complete len:123 (-) Transcript_11837:312-680(-)
MDHSYQPMSASHYAAAYDSYPRTSTEASSPFSSSSQPASSQSSQRQHSSSSPSAYTSFLTLLIASFVLNSPILLLFAVSSHSELCVEAMHEMHSAIVSSPLFAMVSRRSRCYHRQGTIMACL